MKPLFFSLLVALLAPAALHAGTDIHKLNATLGRGINMGNMFEAPTETAWGNPWSPDYFSIVAEVGFTHVRIPVRWETADRSMAEPPYTISPSFLERIREVVDQALKHGLHAIVNMHHHEALYTDPKGQKERFLAQWEQIAESFKDYPEALLFEILNEPHRNLTPKLWNEFAAAGLERIRKTNPDRAVVIGTADWGGLRALPDLQLPEDDRLILTIHYYNPFQFTHQGASWVGRRANAWLGTEWHGSESERERVHADLAPLLKFREKHDIPVHIGEFGAYSRADLDSRVRWTAFLARTFEEYGFSWAYWEFSAGFGIYSPDTGELLQPLAEALLQKELPSAAQAPDPAAKESR